MRGGSNNGHRAMQSPAVFCDSLNWRSTIALLRACPVEAHVLDAIPATRSSKCVRALLAAFGCRICEADFFAGHLRGESGEPLFMVARRLSSQLAMNAAQFAVASLPNLAAIDARSGHQRIALRIARQIWAALERQVLQIQIAQALANPGSQAILYLDRPASYDACILGRVETAVDIRLYGARRSIGGRAMLIGRILAHLSRPLVWRWLGPLWRPALRPPDAAKRPGLLLVQEDEVSPDRSYRTQPHWLAMGDHPPFATYLIRSGPSPVAPADQISSDLIVLDDAALGCIDRGASTHELSTRLASDARQCLRMALSAKTDWAATACAIAARLLARAGFLVRVCRTLNIRAFLGSEPYFFDADAVHIFGPELRIATVMFQYSNVAFTNVMTAATPDHMLLFSPRYAAMWPYAGIRPQRMIAAGYPFDAAFGLVRERAAEWRRRLERSGARFVICYFDENVGPPSKYGFMAQSELDDELRELAQLVLDHHDVGVIFKSQFRKRSPTARLPADSVLRDAMATGRVIELCVGTHRNIVFPAEAALASDLAIGHLIGATAALEAALAGTRCLLINLNGTRTAHDEVYAKGRIVFHSLAEALRAATMLRAGDPAYRSLGDWSEFIHEFDPFRDGLAASRLRALLATLLSAA
jgi:hypothetical protein